MTYRRVVDIMRDLHHMIAIEINGETMEPTEIAGVELQSVSDDETPQETTKTEQTPKGDLVERLPEVSQDAQKVAETFEEADARDFQLDIFSDD